MSARQTTRKRLTAKERREGILHAAVEVFAERGYHASSIDDIARAAGISKALIYEHFASKEDLHARLLEENARELLERLGQVIAGKELAAARLQAGLDGFFLFVEERRGAWRILFREATDPRTAKVLERIVDQVTGVVAALIAEDPGARSLPGGSESAREENIRMLAQMLVGAVQSLANWWADHQEVPRERLVERVMDFAWVGLDRLRTGEHWAEPRA
ncbi:MAG: TetR/AcrR family transcriptional regulator [Thermoleophilaceae bacterium]